MNQILVSTIYNKVNLIHFNPYIAQIQIYEMDPAITYKFQHSIQIPNSNNLH